MLLNCYSLDDFLVRTGDTLMFWFFQLRSAFLPQKSMRQWSRDGLDDYVLLPALEGFVRRLDCYFVSHFRRPYDDPDPDGEYLRRVQADLGQQTWSFIWVDWTCTPQRSRSSPEKAYFHRCLRTMSGIIRDSGFAYFYPPFEPRLWILYEITEYTFTCSEGILMTPDIEPFLQHIREMLKTGVQATLAKHGYRCSYDRDRQYLTSWLEVLVLVKRLEFSSDEIRHIMNLMTWHDRCYIPSRSGLALHKHEGTLVVNGETHTFTPYPRWVSAKNAHFVSIS